MHNIRDAFNVINSNFVPYHTDTFVFHSTITTVNEFK